MFHTPVPSHTDSVMTGDTKAPRVLFQEGHSCPSCRTPSLKNSRSKSPTYAPSLRPTAGSGLALCHSAPVFFPSFPCPQSTFEPFGTLLTSCARVLMEIQLSSLQTVHTSLDQSAPAWSSRLTSLFTMVAARGSRLKTLDSVFTMLAHSGILKLWGGPAPPSPSPESNF